MQRARFRLSEPVVLDPYPDSLLDELPDDTPGPEALYDARESMDPAFVIALQRLPSHLRAVLVLRDVAGFSSEEVAAILGSTEEEVAGALRRARAVVTDRPLAPPTDPIAEKRLMRGFARAFGLGDLDALADLLTEDTLVVVPSEPFEYQGRAAARAFFATLPPSGGNLRSFHIVATRANGQPAFALYLDGDAHSLIALRVSGPLVSEITAFPDPTFFGFFRLPATLEP